MTATLKAIETVYRGYRFRSRLEARWAVFFDTLGIKYEYEKEGYDLDGMWYLPDFWLPSQECWLEVKGQEATDDECEKAGRLAVASKKAVHILWGDIGLPEGDLRGIQTFVYKEGFADLEKWPNLDWHSFSRFCVCPICGKAGITSLGRVSFLPCNCVASIALRKDAIDLVMGLVDRAYWLRKIETFLAAPDSPMMQDAYTAARQARFEHGERP